MSSTRTTLLLLSLLAYSVSGFAADARPTRIVVLGVTHAGQLVAESYQPAVLRAFIGRVKPDAIAVERAPEEFARGSHYEFTYEIQDIAVPYAREKQIALLPFDWMPDADDQLLAFNVDLGEPPFVRGPRTYSNFHSFSAPAALTRTLFYAESDVERQRHRVWYEKPNANPRADFARRLFLYRTFMQAMRIARGASAVAPGGTVLVIVGSMHKDDLEAILRKESDLEVVPPTQFGAPSAEEIAREIRPKDLAAIATFNLLGVQSRSGNVDWKWLPRVVERLPDGPERLLLATRLGLLTGALTPHQAIERYLSLQATKGTAFTWTGVVDTRRLDSFADPFGNLTVEQRAALEEARERLKVGEKEQAVALRTRLEAELTPLKAAQLRAYWTEWVEQ